MTFNAINTTPGRCMVVLLMAGLLTIGLACRPATQPEVGEVEVAARQALADTMHTSLREELLASWYPRAVDTEYGGFLSNFAYDWQVLPAQDKMIVTQARHVWTTARAAAFGTRGRVSRSAIGDPRHVFSSINFGNLIPKQRPLLPRTHRCGSA